MCKNVYACAHIYEHIHAHTNTHIHMYTQTDKWVWFSLGALYSLPYATTQLSLVNKYYIRHTLEKYFSWKCYLETNTRKIDFYKGRNVSLVRRKIRIIKNAYIQEAMILKLN